MFGGMNNVDQPGLINQPGGFDNQGVERLSGKDACVLLGIKRETLYAYASRGLVRSVPAEDGRGRLYLRADLERLKSRSDARRGHGPVAASALRWGEPVLRSEVTQISSKGPLYRGHSAVDLANAGASFESVAELLWSGALPAERPSWTVADPSLPAARLTELLMENAHPLAALMLALPALATRDSMRFAMANDAELVRARLLIRRLTALVALPKAPSRPHAALDEPTVARTLLAAAGVRRTDAAEEAVEKALVLLADHELASSTFAVRVVASTGADLYACLLAGLAALSGPRHGGACDRIEALVREIGRPERAKAIVSARARRGEYLLELGHPLYPEGDPRTPPLLEAAEKLGGKKLAVASLFALLDATKQAGFPPPTSDVGLVAVALALGAGPGFASALFAIARLSGWIAHALEQRKEPSLLRPRSS